MRKQQILECPASRWTDLLDFLAAMNTCEEHSIGYLGTDVPTILDDLSEIPTPRFNAFLLALDTPTGNIVGALGTETDPEIGRAWLYGPFVDRSSTATWDLIADALYEKTEARMPPDVTEHELCIGIRNSRVEAFGSRHGFVPFSHSISLSLLRSDRIPYGDPPSMIRPFVRNEHEALVTLHERLFPKTYYTGKQILNLIGDTGQVFVAGTARNLIGYVLVRVSPVIGTGTIEFVGVAATSRNRGIGSNLIARGVAWAFSRPRIGEISLTVSASNSAALALYDKHGFRRGKEIVGLRRVGTTDSEESISLQVGTPPSAFH